MRKVSSIIFGFLMLGLFGYVGYLVVAWLAAALQDVDSTVGAAIIASAATVISSVSIASYNARKARERVAFEAHREKKAEIYNEFMDVVVETMRYIKSGKDGDDGLPEDIQEFFFRFTSRVTVYGGPGVVKAYGAWRSAYSGDNNPVGSKSGLLLIDSLFREMRADLGESNKGIGKHELLGLFIIGGKSELAREANNVIQSDARSSRG